MLLLESLDLPQRSVSFLAYSGDRLRVRDEFARLAEVSAALGFRDLVLHFASSGGGFTQIEAYVGPESGETGSVCLGADPFPMDPSPNAVATMPAISVHGELKDGTPRYRLEFECCGESRPLLDATLALVLATWGEEDRGVLELRTALYEIGAHYFDHADEIRLKSAGPCADQIRLGMRFDGDQISGKFEDDGPAFDPSSSARVHLKAGEATISREVGWFCRLLDEYQHSHEANGNSIGFHKRVGR